MNRILQTERTFLKPLKPENLDFVHSLNSLAESNRYNTLGIPESKEVTSKILQNMIQESKKNPPIGITFLIEEKTTEASIGMLGLKFGKANYKRAEVWYKIHPEYWKRGFATEALNRILDYCFKDLDLHRIEAGCAIENLASIRVLEKVGFTREGRGRKVLPLDSGWSDNFEYAILDTDPRIF